jgi:hypothetical protein
MPRITCPTCGAALDVTPDMIGETVECGSCQAHFVAQERKPPARRTVADEDRPSRLRGEEDDRPSRRRRDEEDYEDDYDDRPRRRRPATGPHPMAITSMIMGIGSLLLSFVSLVCCVGFVSAPLAVVAVVLGIIGMKPGSKGYAITGIITGGLSILMAVLAVVVFGAVLAFAPKNNPNNFPGNNPPPWKQPPPPPPPPFRR